MKPDDDEDFSLAAFTQSLRRRKWLVGCVTVFCGTVAGLLAFTTKPYFRADVVVTEVREHGAGSLGALASQLGGLASIAGVNLGAGNSGTPAQESAAVMESHYLAEEFIKRNGLIPVLLKKSSKPPTLWLAAKELIENVLTIHKDPRKGTTTVGMQWTDPELAAKWANAYVALTNELLRTRALEESNRNIVYLNQELAKTDSVDLRRVMYSLIESETKNLMIANGRVEYAFTVVDPAVPPELKLGPHRLLNTLVGIMLGFALGVAIAWALNRAAAMRDTVHKVNALG